MTHHRFPTTKPRKRKTWRACPRLEMLEDRTAPAVIVVTSTSDTTATDGMLTLREAIQAATTNTSVDGSPAGEPTPDTIVFAATLQGQTITLGGAELALTGGGDLSIVGPGGVKDGITVDANNASRAFNVSSPDAVTLMNLTITGGNAGAGDVDGGGLTNIGANTTLTNVRVTGNRATGFGADGGGIANERMLTLDNTEVSNNTTIDQGGGIYHDTPTTNATLIIRNGSRITGNTAMNDNGGGLLLHQSGGNTSTVTIEDSTIAGNAALRTGAEGGGILHNGGTVTINRSTVSGNVANVDGGGIFSGFGAGTLNIDNSTLGGNLAGTNGGGIRVGGVGNTVTISNSTIARNAAFGSGGGVYRGSGTAILNSSIVALNQASGANDDIGGTVTNNNTFVGTTSGDPRLGPLQDNGGPTFTFALLSFSPNIDTGTAGPTMDQRGFPRPVGAGTDRGSVERFSSTTTVMLEVLQNGTAVTGTSTALPVTLRATVMSSAAGITPTGSVNFYRDPTPTDPTDAPVQLNSTPVQLDDMGMASLPNVNLPSTSGLFARFVPSSAAFNSSASAQQTITATVRSTVGVFDPNAVFQLLNQNTTTTTGPDFSYSFGFVGSQPVVGNWTGAMSGVKLPGVVRNAGGLLQWTLADENPPVLPNLPDFSYGVAGLTPVSGDWNGSGTDGIGVYNPATGLWQLRNTPNTGDPQFTFTFGGAGFLPVVGDWDGDGTDTVGVYNPSTGQWFLAAANTDGMSPALFTPAFVFNPSGATNARPVTGDWDGDGTDGIGVFFPQTGPNAGFGGFLLKQTASAGAPDVNGGNVILAGLDFWLPVTGNWGVAPTTSNELLAPSPLMLGEGGVPGGQSINALQLQSIVDGALGRLASADADPAVLNALIETQFVLADLPGGTLGLADVANSRVLIDVDGAGAGWFVDSTPWEDSEFASGSVAGVDLLSAVLHEMGHVAGHDHEADGLMAESLSAGVRHTDALDALFGSGLGEPGPDAPEVAIP